MRHEATRNENARAGRSMLTEATIAGLPPVLFGLGISLSVLLRAPLNQLIIGGPTRVRYAVGSGGTWLVGVGVLVGVGGDSPNSK